MFKWLVNRITDILLAFLVSTVLLGYAAMHYPQYFPAKFYSYWPSSFAPTQTVTTAQMKP